MLTGTPEGVWCNLIYLCGDGSYIVIARTDGRVNHNVKLDGAISGRTAQTRSTSCCTLSKPPKCRAAASTPQPISSRTCTTGRVK